MKKIFALLMAIAIAFAMPVMAFAEAPVALPQDVTENPINEAPAFIEFGWEVFAGVVVLAVLIIAIIKFVRTPRKEQLEELRKWLLQAVITAEEIFGSKAGEAKLSFVYDMFVSHLPWLARIITFAKFSEIVDDALEDMKLLLQKKPDLIHPVQEIK